MKNHYLRISVLILMAGGVPQLAVADKYDDIVERMSSASEQKTDGKSTADAESSPTPTTDKKLFRVVDKNGKVSFTDVKPDGGEVSDVPTSAYPKTNVIDTKRQSLRQYEAEIDARIKAREQAQAAYEKNVQKAQERLSRALKYQDENKQPMTNEWQKTRKGRFLKKSYRERQQALQDSVDEATEYLKETQEARP